MLAKGKIPAQTAEAIPTKIVAFFGTRLVYVNFLKERGKRPSRAIL